MADTQAKQQNTAPTQFPPVVAVLGHVDHGKTTLLDAIRKTSIADREHGGITQGIGASSVEIVHEGKKRRITFIDTPGHEAFSKMRSRGATVADITLLIVSAADGVKPQTKESIEVIKAAGMPYIAVLTKADLDTAMADKVKQQLLGEEMLLEGYGGDVPVIEVSAKTSLNIKELLDLILLVHDLHPKENISSKGSLEAIIIESRLDQKAGPRATAVIKNGTIHVRETLSTEDQSFKVRTIINADGLQIQEATVGDAVELLGFSAVPGVGSVLREGAAATETKALSATPLQRELVYTAPQEEAGLAVVIAADTQGSLEAILYSLPKEVKVISKKTGEVTEADILMAKSTGAVVLGFNTKIRPDVQKLAMTEKVLARNYTIIYEMLDEIGDVIEGKRLAGIEQVFGTAQIQASFPFEKTQVLGVKVLDGRVAKGDKVRLERGSETIGEATIASLRSGKESVSKVEKGREAGILINPLLDFRVGDVIISHS